MAATKRPARAASGESKNIGRHAPKRAVRRTYSNRKLKSVLVARYGQKSVRKWAQAISAEAGITVTFGTLSRALHGTAPEGARLRQALGYPAMVPTPACATCGEVHINKRCPTRRKPPAGPRKDWKGLAKFLWAAYLGLMQMEMRR